MKLSKNKFKCGCNGDSIVRCVTTFEDHNFFYGQAQGRFIPSYQDSRNGFFPSAIDSRTGQGAYQNRQIFVAQNNQQPSTSAFFPFGNYPVVSRLEQKSN
uniref:CSON000950 protein n=1 Tax=Culicoides sonorensis TaxID=179676 RepID=A0A336KXE5_CULSO